MIFYIYPNGYKGKINFQSEVFQLGEMSFKNFWAKQGFNTFERMINKNPERIESTVIEDDIGKEYSFDQFLEILSKLNVIRE